MYSFCNKAGISGFGIRKFYPFCTGIINWGVPLSEWHIIMKIIALAVLKLVKESYSLSLKRIRYAISLDYENEVEKIFSMRNTENIKMY